MATPAISSSKFKSAAVAYVGAAAVQKAAPFLLLLILTRQISVEAFGQVSVLTSVFVLTLAIGGLGLESAAFRGNFLAETDDARRVYFGALAKIAVTGPLALGAVFVATAFLAGDGILGIPVSQLAMVVGGAALFAAATTLPLAKLRSEERVSAYVTCSLLPTVVQVCTKLVLCVGLGLDARGWAMGDLIAGVFVFMLTLRLQARFLLEFPIDWAAARSILRVGLPLLPHVVSSWALNLSDRLIIAALIGISTVGQYSLASQLASVGMILSAELNRAVSPEYGRVIRGGDGAEEHLSHIVRTQRLLAIPIFGLTSLGSSAFIYWFAPDAYLVGVSWSIILSAGYMLYSWYYPAMNVLSIAEGRTVWMPIITMTSAGLNVGLNLLLVTHLGPIVCAFTTVAGYGFLFAATSLYAGSRPALKWGRQTSIYALLMFLLLVFSGAAIAHIQP